MSPERDFKPLFTWRSAICDSDLPPTTRLVALTLSLHMNERGGSCFPSAAQLAQETGLGVSTVREHRKTLERTGWLACVERGGIRGKARRASAYEATTPPAAGPVQETDVTPPANGDDPSSSRTPVLQELSMELSNAADAAPSSRKKNEIDPNARVVTLAWWNEQNPKPLQKFVAVQGIVDQALKAGYHQEAVLAALRTVGRTSQIVGWKLEEVLKRSQPKRDPRGLNHDRTGE